ncbi:hypothetical protein BJX99DRAFT_254030 [Aspergillus californicus]
MTFKTRIHDALHSSKSTNQEGPMVDNSNHDDNELIAMVLEATREGDLERYNTAAPELFKRLGEAVKLDPFYDDPNIEQESSGDFGTSSLIECLLEPIVVAISNVLNGQHTVLTEVLLQQAFELPPRARQYIKLCAIERAVSARDITALHTVFADGLDTTEAAKLMDLLSLPAHDSDGLRTLLTEWLVSDDRILSKKDSKAFKSRWFFHEDPNRALGRWRLHYLEMCIVSCNKQTPMLDIIWPAYQAVAKGCQPHPKYSHERFVKKLVEFDAAQFLEFARREIVPVMNAQREGHLSAYFKAQGSGDKEHEAFLTYWATYLSQGVYGL